MSWRRQINRSNHNVNPVLFFCYWEAKFGRDDFTYNSHLCITGVRDLRNQSRGAKYEGSTEKENQSG